MTAWHWYETDKHLPKITNGDGTSDYEDQYHKIIERMEDHLQKMLKHAEALHIRPRRK